MAYTLKDHHDCFSRQLKELLDTYSKSKKDIESDIADIITTPIQGDRVPGFSTLHVRKTRLPLKEYDIGKRGGLRLVYMVNDELKWILMIAIYSKKGYKKESVVQRMVKDNLKSILSSLD